MADGVAEDGQAFLLPRLHNSRPPLQGAGRLHHGGGNRLELLWVSDDETESYLRDE